MEKLMGLEREAVIVELTTASVDRQPILEPLKSSAESSLFRWKEPCEIKLPPLPKRQTEEMRFDELFEPFRFDECEEIARNSDGSLKKLTSEQLKSIRSWGNFEVESARFVGQKHKWQLSCILQKGIARDHKNLNLALAKALKFFVIYAKDRYNARFFSLGHSCRGVSKGLLLLIDLFLGRPHNVPIDLEVKLASEQLAHLLAELDVKNDVDLQKIEAFAELIELQMKKAMKRRSYRNDLELQQKQETIVPVYIFNSAGGKIEIDLRPRNSQLWAELSPRITYIIEKDRLSGWFHQFRHDLFLRLKAEIVDNDNLVEKVQKEVDEEQIRRIFQALRADEEIQKICGGQADFLINVARANMIVSRVEQRYDEKLSAELLKLKNDLTEKYPIRSKINRWIQRQRKAYEQQFHENNKWQKHEWILQESKQEGLEQLAYFIQRDLNFIKDHQPPLKSELIKITQPARIFTFRTRIWMPKNWIITKTDPESNTSEVIKTVISPMVERERLLGTNDGNRYSVKKTIDRLVSTKWPFWRWSNFFHRVWCWTWNAIFTLCVVIPWCSPFSIRAALSHQKFYPDYSLSCVNGQLHPDPSSLTHTYISRLRALWGHVRKSRAKFEAAADRGFVSKDVIRPLNRLWNYVVKGAIGSVILTVMPPFCIFASVVSFALGLLAPVFMPIVVLLAHLFMLLIWDFDCPYKHHTFLRRNRALLLFEAIIYRLIFLSVIQPAGIIVFVIVICPLCSILITVGAYVRYGIRSAWDSLMFHIIIKRHGRIPSVNNWVAKRISGPGISSGYFYQIRPGQALALLQLELQRKELQSFEQMAMSQLRKPLESYEEWVRLTLDPFGVQISQQHQLYDKVTGSSTKIRSDLMDKLAKRRNFLKTTVTRDSNLHLVKQTAEDLEITMESAAELTEKFHSHSPVLSLVNLQELFTSYHLADGDWRGLAEQIFTSIFSQEFLQPLEATDTRFELKVQHVDLNDYMEQLITAKHSEDLERVERLVTKAPKLENSIIPKPIFLEIFSCEFSPRSSYTNRSQFSSEAPGYMAHPGLVMATIAGKRQLHGVTLEWLKEPNNRAFVVELIKIKRPQVNVNVVNVEDIVIDETLQI